MAKTKMIEIKLVRSEIGLKPNQVKTLKALGLTKVNQVVKKPDNEAVRGMIATVNHLVEIL
ncbi:MAG TPA: 50S ribosomal protein L30 [Acholeplasmataceae bacterium]|jgi:large subunit ribosomal protein L30|nr:50S ribosomal protein L30 [Acholeplasmataceae bacterium]